MHFIEGILNGFAEIWAHKLRSLLTMTCVMLGVASLVVITGFIMGLFKNWEIWTQEMNNILNVTAEPDTVPDKLKHLAGLSNGLTLEDANAIRRLTRYGHYVAPMIQGGGNLRYRTNTVSLRLMASTPDSATIGHYTVERGRFLGDLDLDRKQRVIVLGSKAVRMLFKRNEDPLGQTVYLQDIPFKVVGVFKHYQADEGEFNMLDFKNSVAYVPLTTYQQLLPARAAINSIEVQAGSVADLPRVVDELNSILLRTHRGVPDFKVRTNEENSNALNNIRNGFFAVGGGVGVITLLVGGIGIMNLMLASINDRVREIGIRKAIGAWNRDIFVQFVAEAVALSSLGGVLGVGAGVLVIRLVRVAMTGPGANFPPPVLATSSLVVGFAFSVSVGIIAGLYPAFCASRLDPIEALRYE